MYKKELGIIGIGKIGSGLLKRFISTDTLNKNEIIIFDIDEDKRNMRSKEYNVEIAENNADLVRSSKNVLIAVIPQVIDTVLSEIGPIITEQQTIISIAAGISLTHITKFINKLQHL
jgi:pyrroline-5-carboxylate reductase